MKAFKAAALQVDYAQVRLEAIVESIGPALLKRFKRDSAQRGGEKYLVDPTKINCEWFLHQTLAFVPYGRHWPPIDPTRAEALRELQASEQIMYSGPEDRDSAAAGAEDHADTTPASQARFRPSVVIDNGLSLEVHRYVSPLCCEA